MLSLMGSGRVEESSQSFVATAAPFPPLPPPPPPPPPNVATVTASKQLNLLWQDSTYASTSSFLALGLNSSTLVGTRLGASVSLDTELSPPRYFPAISDRESEEVVEAATLGACPLGSKAAVGNTRGREGWRSG